MNEIIMIEVGQLHHHPENPRKDLGDLGELADSIRKNGVMQNLTVVRGHMINKEEWIRLAKAEGVSKEEALATWDPNGWEPGGFTVVIGNRRMEAAKLAGLETVPCVISDMDYRTQIATMLEENMQRADLTVYEQAQGFQMMMDLGYRPEEISEKTGFSETTVRRRLKMAELDKDIFRKAVGKQITMDDLDRLGQVEDLKTRNELLGAYGDWDFEWKVNTQIKKQKADKVRPKALAMLKAAKLKEIKREETWRSGVSRMYDQTCELDKWDGKTEFIPKTEEPLFWCMNGMDVEFYVKEKKQKAEPVKKTPEELAEEKRIALAWATEERIRKTAREMRQEYARGLKVSPKNAMEMLQWALTAACMMTMGYGQPESALRTMAGLETEYVIPKREKEMFRYIQSLPQSKWPELIFLLFEGDEKNAGSYAYGSRSQMPVWQDCPRIDACYEWLTAYGYTMSTEEIGMMGGTHEVFQTEVKA